MSRRSELRGHERCSQGIGLGVSTTSWPNRPGGSAPRTPAQEAMMHGFRHSIQRPGTTEPGIVVPVSKLTRYAEHRFLGKLSNEPPRNTRRTQSPPLVQALNRQGFVWRHRGPRAGRQHPHGADRNPLTAWRGPHRRLGGEPCSGSDSTK